MHNNRLPSARRIFLTVAAFATLLSLAGCNATITNLTPATLPANPSSIYTISVQVKPRANMAPGTLKVSIVIDGQTYPMTASTQGHDIYDFDYQVPAGRTELAYYVLAAYKFEHDGVFSSREDYTGLQKISIAGRYVLSLEANRGPVGARVSVLGRGFTPNDTIAFDSTPARTVYESPVTVSFFVPAVDANRTYQVTLNNATGSTPVGAFRVDGTALTVTPESLTLATGSSATLTFTLGSPAPAGGLLLDVTTNVPDSIIMPEVLIPEGSTSATVEVTGGRPGSGSLFLKGFGTGELTIPITVP